MLFVFAQRLPGDPAADSYCLALFQHQLLALPPEWAASQQSRRRPAMLLLQPRRWVCAPHLRICQRLLLQMLVCVRLKKSGMTVATYMPAD
jgi:hypothetical protein